MANRLIAPSTPPVTELSSPMIAFCTVFDTDSSTTRLERIQTRANSRFPEILNRITIAK